jgi:hypothetical protein
LEGVLKVPETVKPEPFEAGNTPRVIQNVADQLANVNEQLSKIVDKLSAIAEK